MTASKDININFIDDSTGSVESLNNNTPEKIRSFRYEIKNDTIFELTPAEFSELRKWKIIKLNKDSLVIYWEGITARYYRLP
jgi:hypothetical protein